MKTIKPKPAKPGQRNWKRSPTAKHGLVAVKRAEPVKATSEKALAK